MPGVSLTPPGANGRPDNESEATMTVEQECNDKPAGRLYADGAEIEQFVRSQNERFDIAALLIKMKKAAQAVLEENPPIPTKTATRTGWKLPEIATLARGVLAHHDHVRSCIEDDDPAGAAGQARRTRFTVTANGIIFAAPAPGQQRFNTGQSPQMPVSCKFPSETCRAFDDRNQIG